MPSKAYQNFQTNLQQVDRLLETYDRELARKIGKGKRSLDHLTRAGLVFLCSSFEVYVESCVMESGDIVVKSINAPSEFPRSVKKKISDSVKKEKNELSPILFFDDWKKYYTDLIYYDTKHLNTPKIDNIKELLLNYFGIQNSDIDDNVFPFNNVNDIVSARGDVAHNLFGDKYLKRATLVEYRDTIKAAVTEIDKILYSKLPNTIKKKPWKNTY